MKTFSQNIGRKTAAFALVISAMILATSALMANWPPDDQTKQKIVAAFSAVLTRAAKPSEKAFRSSITGFADSAQAAAKAAVQKELNNQSSNYVIPRDVVIVFYEPEARGGMEATDTDATVDAFKDAWNRAGDQNHKLHVFALPPADGQEHFYKKQLKCCYPVWVP